MRAYNFVDENKQHALYWRDVGTLEAYYEANMDIAAVAPTFNLYDKAWPMRTRAYQYPPAKFVFGEPGRTGMAINSIVSAGSIVSGSVLRNSVLSHDVRVNSYADVDSSVIFSHVNIGRHCRIRHAIIDRDCPHPRRHRHRLRPRRRQEELLRLRQRPHRRHPRLLRLRKPSLPRVPERQRSLVRQG